MLKERLMKLRECRPLIHNITNHVTAGDCANLLLAAGASPIMAEDPLEVEEITSVCGGLNLNIGTPSERKFQAMILAGRKANSLGHPIVLDLVGVGASNFRKTEVERLLAQISPTVLKGNASEIKTLATGIGSNRGVDVAEQDKSSDTTLEMAKALALRYHAVVLVTGAVDLITDGVESYAVSNGHPFMGHITGTGCMLSALTTAFVSSNADGILEAVLASTAMMGIAGERAYHALKDGEGCGSYRVYLMDQIYLISPDILEEEAKYESRK